MATRAFGVRVGAVLSGMCGLVLAPPVGAQAVTAADCAAAVTQADMTACAQQDYATADQSLNSAYRKAMARAQAMDKSLAELNADMPGAVEALKAAQRAWIGYRDGQCDLEGFAARGGTMEPMLVAGCLAETTRRRTAELEQVLVEP